MPRRGIVPASATCRSGALPAELYPHPQSACVKVCCCCNGLQIAACTRTRMASTGCTCRARPGQSTSATTTASARTRAPDTTSAPLCECMASLLDHPS